MMINCQKDLTTDNLNEMKMIVKQMTLSNYKREITCSFFGCESINHNVCLA